MSDGSIAIVGASCRFPGASGLEAFWRLLISGTDAVTEVDADRWSTRFYYHPSRGEPGKSYTWSAGLLSEVGWFDPAFFGISPREAAQMDPQQRLLLELVWHTVEDAGIPASKLAGSATGVYIGASSTDYRDLRLGDPASGDSYFMTGGTLSILANRISYVFDLHGPSLALADGDPIRAVILGTGVNSDGRTIGLSLPSETAQAALIRSVYQRAGVVPDDLAFFEMHGTGTPAGDPIEAAAVGLALGGGRSTPLPIGSVKTNIGHLEPASGMAGLIKAALALERGSVPPTLHCETPNSNIPFDAL